MRDAGQGSPEAQGARVTAVPGEARAHVQSVHILADDEAQQPYTLQLHQRHVRARGPRALEGGVESGRQATLLHGPHAVRAPDGRGQVGGRWKGRGKAGPETDGGDQKRRRQAHSETEKQRIKIGGMQRDREMERDIKRKTESKTEIEL